MANEVTIMPTKVSANAYFTVRHLAGLPARARGAADVHPDQRDQGRRLRHRRHPHVHRRRRAHRSTGRGRHRRGRVRRRVDHLAGLGETDLTAGGGVHPGQRRQPDDLARRSSTALRAINPWVDQADFDHHGYARGHRDAAAPRRASSSACRRSSAARGRSSRRPGSPTRSPAAQTSIKGVNGPAA